MRAERTEGRERRTFLGGFDIDKCICAINIANVSLISLQDLFKSLDNALQIALVQMCPQSYFRLLLFAGFSFHKSNIYQTFRQWNMINAIHTKQIKSQRIEFVRKVDFAKSPLRLCYLQQKLVTIDFVFSARVFWLLFVLTYFPNKCVSQSCFLKNHIDWLLDLEIEMAID